MFSETVPAAKTTKGKMLEILDQLAVDHPGKVLEAVGKYPYDASKPPALPAPANDAAASPANSANSDPSLGELESFFAPIGRGTTDNTETEGATTAGATSWRRWLMGRCAKAVPDMKMGCTSMTLAKDIIGLVEDVRVFGKDKYKEMNMMTRIGTVLCKYVTPRDDRVRELMTVFRTEVKQNMLSMVDDPNMSADNLEDFS